jgi:hypothetical protein
MFSRWPDRASLWLLLPGCLFSALLWAGLCAESAYGLAQPNGQQGSKCPERLPKFGWSWLDQQQLEAFRPCLGPALNSLLLCMALIGGQSVSQILFHLIKQSSPAKQISNTFKKSIIFPMH